MNHFSNHQNRPLQIESIDPSEAKLLGEFITRYDLAGLGEGNIIAGANTLAAMACTLANISRPGSGWVSENLSLQVGSNLLTCGSLSTSLLVDRVTSKLADCQNKMIEKLHSAFKMDTDALDDLLRENSLDAVANKKAAAANPAICNIDDLEAAAESEWRDAFTFGDSRTPRTFLSSPKCFVTGYRQEDLMNNLRSVHLRKACAYYGVTDYAELLKLGDIFSALTEGRLAIGELGETVQGHMIIADSTAQLCPALATGGQSARWLERIVWLIDGGNEVPSPAPINGDQWKLSGNAFRSALIEKLIQRYNQNEPLPTLVNYDFSKSQKLWIKFLNSMESRLPGISGTARTFLASLIFGLQGLKAKAAPDKGKIYINEVIAFGKYLIRRMAAAREAMLFSAEEEMRKELMTRILYRLAHGKADTRMIYRSLKISAQQCKELLHELEDKNEVRRVGNEWIRKDEECKTIECAS